MRCECILYGRWVWSMHELHCSVMRKTFIARWTWLCYGCAMRGACQQRQHRHLSHYSIWRVDRQDVVAKLHWEARRTDLSCLTQISLDLVTRFLQGAITIRQHNYINSGKDGDHGVGLSHDRHMLTLYATLRARAHSLLVGQLWHQHRYHTQ